MADTEYECRNCYKQIDQYGYFCWGQRCANKTLSRNITCKACEQRAKDNLKKKEEEARKEQLRKEIQAKSKSLAEDVKKYQNS